ncbi:MAG: hypothetical protein C0523_05500 [Cytophaga sp.]|nr:hypothetical protein [Cytophaga sp.]
MKKINIILAFIVFGLFAFSAKHSLRYSGTASDLQSGEFYYTEEHEEWQSGEHTTETRIQFKDDQNKVIVSKRIDYSRNTFSPDFLQKDNRDGYMEGSSTVGEWTTLQFRKNSGKELQTKKIKIPSPAVVDGGFTHFVKAHWEEIMNGERITFYFAVPSQLDYYAFRVFKTNELTSTGKNTVTLRMEPDAFILRKLLPPILLQYNAGSKRLMQYEGISTINDPKGKSYRVRIVYPVTGP